MSDASSTNSRVVDVITFLAAHPTETFTLAEIARHLGLSNGSAHRVLTSLTEARFLSRHPKHKTYSLGMALVAIGQAALEKHRGIDIARREMARLCAEMNVQCGAFTIVDDEVLLLAKEGTPRSQDGLSRVGERRAFIPPLGMCHMAWRSEAEIRAYLDKASTYMSDATREYLSSVFPLIRRRGYSIVANGPGQHRLRDATVQPLGRPHDDAYWSSLKEVFDLLPPKELQLIELGDAGADGINYISAPVFSHTGDVCLEIVLSALPANPSVKDIERYAERLCLATAIVTSETHGWKPDAGSSGERPQAAKFRRAR